MTGRKSPTRQFCGLWAVESPPGALGHILGPALYRRHPEEGMQDKKPSRNHDREKPLKKGGVFRGRGVLNSEGLSWRRMQSRSKGSRGRARPTDR